MLPKLSYQTNSYYYTKSNTNIKQEPIETEKPEVKKEEPVESSKVQSSSLEIIVSQNQAMISRSTSPNKNINKPYEFEEVEIDGAIYYKTQNEKGEDCFVSAYIYHCKIEKTNSNEDITKILNTYSSNPYATENLYGFNNNNYTDNYGYTHSFTQENQYKHTETVKDTNGNIIREVTTNVNQNSGKITQVTSYSDGRKEVFVYTLDEDGEEVPLQKIEYDTNQQIISSTKIEYEDNGNIIMQVDKQDGSTEVTVYNEDGNILTTTTFDHGEEQNVVKHTEEDNESQQESAYARMKREQAEKAEAEKNKQNIIDKKPLEEQKTDLKQEIPEFAKKYLLHKKTKPYQNKTIILQL